MRRILLSSVAASAVLAFAAPAFAQDVSQPSNVFDLGQLTVMAPGEREKGLEGEATSESRVSADEMYTFNRNRLDDALTLVSGVAVTQGSGSRNEPTISVRGFDRYQVPVYIDGIRVYLPYDNRLDLSRFITPDLAEVQVQKGYVSILNGPGGMGGAINLVTRKPTKEYEVEARAGVDLGNTGGYSAFNSMMSLGTKQDKYYIQATGAFVDSDGWFLPQGFTPVNWYAEDGGKRDFSDTSDWRINTKFGYTPNETDEYVVNYTNQQGEKGAPYDIQNAVITPNGTKAPFPGTTTQRNWTWPWWNYSSLSFVSKTELAPTARLNTRWYYNEFKNLLSAYDDNSFTTQTANRAFNSYYDDTSYGVDVEVAYDIHPQDTLRGIITYRNDEHQSQQHRRPTFNGVGIWDPELSQTENTLSFGLENTFRVTQNFDFVAGVSYDYRDLTSAWDYSTTTGMFEYPLTTDDAVNWQFAAIYRYSEKGLVSASVSSRTRFPTLWERFSSRFGTAEPNPGLLAERATNYQIGWSDKFFGNSLALGGAIFYSEVTNLIQTVYVATNITQNQNVGNSDNYGIELQAEWNAATNLVLGGNYTYTIVDITSSSVPGIQPVGTPEHLAFLYAKWKPWEQWTLIPSVQLSSSRWTNIANPAAANLPGGYVQTAGYALANLSLEYQPTAQLNLALGMRNIFDTEYQTQYLFPQAGRTFFVNGKYVF